ncbi:MAG: PQQ-binding-like beta-propeller repeat protein [Planctomycetota bacterium]
MLPALDDGTLFLSNGVKIRALGLFGQEEKWEYDGPASGSQARVNLAAEFPIVVDRNVLYASLEMPVERETQIWNYTPQMAVPERRLHALDATTGRLLWSHARYAPEGSTAEERFFVSKLSVTSRPLVIGDDLYVSATRFHTGYHHYVCCFDRRTGRLRWSTFVGAGQMEQNMFGNRIRECVSGHLVMHRGQLWYSTNIGMIASVDARLGTLRNVIRYEQVGIPRQQRIYRSVFERSPGWANNEPIVVGDEIFFTPIDSQDLIAVDTQIGRGRRVLTRSPDDRYRYIVGPVRGAIVVCGTKIAFHDVATRKTDVSSIAFDSTSYRENREAGVIGRPLLAGDQLVTPVRYRPPRERQLVDRLFIWDLAGRRVVNEIDPAQGSAGGPVAGNLASNGEVVVLAATDDSRTLTFVRSFFDEAEILARLRRRTESDPADPEPHFQYAELGLQSGSIKVDVAIRAYERAKELAEALGISGTEARQKSRDALYRLYLDLALGAEARRQEAGLDVARAFDLALVNAGDARAEVELLFHRMAKAFEMRDRASVEKAYARLMRDHADEIYDHRDVFRTIAPALETNRRYGRAGFVATVVAATVEETYRRFPQAVDLYQTLIRDYPRESLAGDTAWRYARDRIEDIIRRNGREVYAAEEARAKELYERGRGEGGVDALERLMELFPNSTLVAKAHLALARRQIDEGRTSEAATSIASSLTRVDEPEGELLVSLARAFEDLGLRDSARSAWIYARARTPLDTLGAEGDGAPATVSELADAAIARLAAPPVAAPSLAFETKRAWSVGTRDQRDPWVLVEPEGRAPAVFADRFLAYRGGVIHAFSTGSDKPLWTLDSEVAPLQEALFWSDDRLVARIDNAYVVIDADTGREAWRAGVDNQLLSAVATGHGKVYGIVQPHSLAANFRLQGRSLIDGELIFDLAFDGIPPQRIEVGDRWVGVALDADPVFHLVDPFTGRRAAGLAEGFRYDEVLRPFLTENGLFVAVPYDRPDGERSVQGIDPDTGATRWSRRLADQGVRFWIEDARRMVYLLRDAREGRGTLVAADVRTGAPLLEAALDDGVSVQHGSILAGDRLYAVLSRPTRAGGTQRAQFVEAFSLDGKELALALGRLRPQPARSAFIREGPVGQRLRGRCRNPGAASADARRCCGSSRQTKDACDPESTPRTTVSRRTSGTWSSCATAP